MIIGSEFNKKYHKFLREIGDLSQNDATHKISVQDMNSSLNSDRTEIKNVLEYLQELGYINIETIGGPLLYGHITITEQGLDKFQELKD
jgi:Mn-dependent DtxR family transcriptional regulator